MDNQYKHKSADGTERQFSFGFLPPVESIPVQIAIVKVIGEALFEAFIGKGDAKSKDEAAKTLLDQASSVAIGVMLSKMEPSEVLKTMEAVFRYVNVDGRKLDMNSDFSGGRNKEMWTVFIQALRYNFQDFLPASRSPSVQG